MLDLVLLVADKDAQFALRGALQRPRAMGIRAIEFECFVHPQHDGGSRKTGPSILRLKRIAARHALLVLDWEGCGASGSERELEGALDSRLAQDWGTRSKAIVISPEVDIWLWGSDNALETQMAWSDPMHIRPWLLENGFTFNGDGKPDRPKEALGRALRHARLPRSSALYEQIAKRISLQQCRDPAFQRLRRQLQNWFPATGADDQPLA